MKDKLIDTGVIGGGRGITYVDGKYYLLSDSPAKVCVSEDLEHWTEYNLNSNYLKPEDIVYGNGVFVISGDSGSTNNTYIYTSTNGTTWTARTINTGRNFSIPANSIKFINNKFILLLGIVGLDADGKRTKTENWFYESTNGINWKKHTLIINSSENFDQMDIEYYNKTYVRVGCSGSIYTSSNLDNWTKRNSGVKDKLVGISVGKSQFVVTGDNGTILTSPNGTKWTKQNSGTDSYLIRSRYANGMYIACGYNGTLLQSIDGISWADISSNHSGLRYGLAYNNINNVIVITAHHFKSGTIPLDILNLTRELLTNTEEDSSLFFFNKNLELLGIVDYFISLRWRRKYFEAGEFEIVLPVDKNTMRFVSDDVIVMRNNYTEAGIIDTIEYSDDGTDEEVTISGRFLSSLLERRIVKSKINFNGNTIEGMNTIVNAMTPLTTQWETSQVTMSSPHIEFQCTYKNVYEYLRKLAEYSNIGVRVVPNVESKVYMFEVWKGLDRTSTQSTNEQYAFSDDKFNIEQGTLVISSKTKATYILVGGTGEDADRTVVSVDNGKTGFDRYEVFSDQSSLSNDGLSTNEYINQLKTVGTGILSDGTFKLEVTASVQQDYKTKWNLGDIVDIKKDKWGVSTTYRIIEVEEIIENGKKTIYPTFGSPLASAWDDE